MPYVNHHRERYFIELIKIWKEWGGVKPATPGLVVTNVIHWTTQPFLSSNSCSKVSSNTEMINLYLIIVQKMFRGLTLNGYIT